MLDQEAGLAHELVGLLGLDAARAVAPVVGLGDLVLVLVLVLGLGGDAVLEDGVEVGLDVVGVDVVVVLLLLVVVGRLAGLGRCALLRRRDRGGLGLVLDELVAELGARPPPRPRSSSSIVFLDDVVDLVGLFGESSSSSSSGASSSRSSSEMSSSAIGSFAGGPCAGGS